MRVHDGSEGCSVAHVRDVISGCAGEVMADMDWRDGGSVGLFGKRIGETNGLLMLVLPFAEDVVFSLRIFELCYFGNIVNDGVVTWPGKSGWVVGWCLLDVLR